MPLLNVEEKLKNINFTDEQIKNVMNQGKNKNSRKNSKSKSSNSSVESNQSLASGIDHKKIIRKEDLKNKNSILNSDLPNSQERKSQLKKSQENKNPNLINLPNIQKIENNTRGFIPDFTNMMCEGFYSKVAALLFP